ncbi:hypothetical protein THERMOT_81 [Bathymodiolus thermophilus thioautotrophic gill symbiont]|uniref:Uncharacterized protein n=1 Tax=Bathymodiolus thermophilus thioautotrophic gill symbiont TaxID=2360 RepID=A0A8H8XDC7_9GAMM|nr:hypothetical protein THERMOT_81 [Bathymodiolus thermophilus thioautotrophic gill symbiont]CAB5499651.1 hypothetical protein THERMOS_1057 [Bathymodiolus thermophilus thioautotrophic gill symbiont]
MSFAGLRLGLKNYQVGEKWILDDYLYLCKGLQWSEYFYSNNKINLEIMPLHSLINKISKGEKIVFDFSY